MDKRILIINNIKLPLNASFEEAFSISAKKLKKYGIKIEEPKFSIYKRSVDARNKSDVHYVTSVAISGIIPEISKVTLAEIGGSLILPTKPLPRVGEEPLTAPPVVVGAGPAGLFAALILAEEGYHPVIIERGADVEARVLEVERFIKDRRLNTECNIQFGAGGAGTFSDGKLVTRVNDSYVSYVLERFVEFGAPEEIKFLAKPHVGTDVLRKVVSGIINRIKELGGRFLFNTRFIAERLEKNRITRVITTSGEIKAGALILAVGHSARDTYSELYRSSLMLEGKNFSVGMRIEHLAEDIDRAMYGDFAGYPGLGHAEYNLSHNTKVRGVYTFCMCPGGVVVPGASEEGGVVVNGMSYHSRNGVNSNCAVVCSVFKEDYGCDPMSAIAFQRDIERKAFLAGGSDYSAPYVTLKDFYAGKAVSEAGRIKPSYMSGGVRLAHPDDYLPSFVTEGIKCALVDFDKRIKGFAAPDAVLSGVESRTSSPIRILRDNSTGLAPGYENLYPAGEGAGYAGGISSAAIDGIRQALALISKYSPNTYIG